MANLLKKDQRATYFTRIIEGHAMAGDRYAERATEGSDRPQRVYTLAVWEGSGSDRVEYQLQLTEDELMTITGDWLTRLGRNRMIDAKKSS